MKKFWIILLAIYATIVTIGCAVFAYLYFTKPVGDKDDLTYASAKDLVNTICYDLGYISEEEYQNSASNQASATLVEFKDDDATTIDKETLNMIGAVDYYLNDRLLAFKYALDENIDENVYYNSKSDDKQQMISFKFNLDKNQAILQFYPNERTSQSYSGHEAYLGEKIIIQKESTGWKLNYKIAQPTTGVYNFYDVKFEADQDGVFKVDAVAVAFNINVVGYDGPELKKYTKIDNSILASIRFSQNLRTKKKLFASSTNPSGASEVQTLSEKEHLDLINDTINSMKDVEIKNYEKDLKSIAFKFKDVDIYQKVLDKLQ